MFLCFLFIVSHPMYELYICNIRIHSLIVLMNFTAFPRRWKTLSSLQWNSLYIPTYLYLGGTVCTSWESAIHFCRTEESHRHSNDQVLYRIYGRLPCSTAARCSKGSEWILVHPGIYKTSIQSIKAFIKGILRILNKCCKLFLRIFSVIGL